MIPDFPQLKPVELTDRDEVNNYFNAYPPEVCELTFANIYIWRHWEKPQLTKINGNLCVFCSPSDEPSYFFEPVGENRIRETVETCLSVAPRLSRVSENFLSKLGPDLIYQEDRDNFDYVYLTEELASLRGKKYDGKRNLIKKFEKNYKAGVRPLSESDVPGCLDLVDRWESNSPEENRNSDQRSRAASQAIREALLNLRALGLGGLVAVINGRVEGFCLGERLNPETAVVHVELASREIAGLHQFMNRECARTIWKEFRYLNREQDAGLPGLRRSKLSYHPHCLLKKYNIFNP
ncbi:MAG: phosphatidylglycerol lysyltransferase domain-containing protein [Candidatus Saccharicenans sp.]|nr:phosphatidylglycerol lysyltransferase domain-containing protein [Candidatus Saccharicenans sp.]MDI6850133.1 phosphatidylglycerol lysyltransferase domain-containing protein [Candidatus Saccharicenans sp.]